LKAALLPQNELVTDESDVSSKLEETEDAQNENTVLAKATVDNGNSVYLRHNSFFTNETRISHQ